MTLTIEEALSTLPATLGLFGAARLAGLRSHNEETLWGLLPTLAAIEATTATRTIHANYIDRRWVALALLYYGECENELTASLRDLQTGRRFGDVSSEAEKILRTVAEESYNPVTVSEVARTVLSLLHARKEPRAARGTFIECVGVRKLLFLTETVTEDASWLQLVQEMVAL